jgi:hypothetical protein
MRSGDALGGASEGDALGDRLACRFGLGPSMVKGGDREVDSRDPPTTSSEPE